jgi:hypothetical protein
MSERYVIRWKSKVNGRAGQGTKLFEREEAERLALELNHEYPNIEHQVLNAKSPLVMSRRLQPEPEAEEAHAPGAHLVRAE